MTKARLFAFASLAYLTFVGVLAAYIHKPVSRVVSEKIAITGEAAHASALQLSNSDYAQSEKLGTGSNRQSISHRVEAIPQQKSGTLARTLHRESWTTDASIEKPTLATAIRESLNSSCVETPDGQSYVGIVIPRRTARAFFSTLASAARPISGPTGNVFRYQGGAAAVQESTEPPAASGSPPELLIAVAPDQKEDETAVAASVPTQRSRRGPLIPIEQEIFRAKWGQAAYDAARNAAAQEGRRKLEKIR